MQSAARNHNYLRKCHFSPFFLYLISFEPSMQSLEKHKTAKPGAFQPIFTMGLSLCRAGTEICWPGDSQTLLPAVLHRLCQQSQHSRSACPGEPVSSCPSGRQAGAQCKQMLLIWVSSALGQQNPRCCHSLHAVHPSCRALLQVHKYLVLAQFSIVLKCNHLRKMVFGSSGCSSLCVSG